ncbi:MAG TPA: prolyl oligopeptidase family serine peptidase [Terracidiphilus sp.]|jgi:dipeptidyl aminopeptidase/acylaminoacyl peptidase
MNICDVDVSSAITAITASNSYIRCVKLRLLALLASMFVAAHAQGNLNYQKPPQAIVNLVDAKPTPKVEISPGNGQSGRWLLIEALSGLPSIADLAQPEFRLAGLRFNPKTNGPSRGRYATALSLKALPEGAERKVEGLPANAKILFVAWSPDARSVFFVNASDGAENAGLSSWIVDVASARARRLAGLALNGILGEPCEWMPDSKGLICKAVAESRGEAPTHREVPTGPVIQESLGRVTPGPTYEDLLKNPEDEAIFDYYATSQVVLVGLDGKITLVGKPGVVESASASPDQRYALISARHHPYSYLLRFEMFPETISVVDLSTRSTKQLVDKPLEDMIPNIHDAVETGPREVEWRSDAPSTLFWVEASDGGDPRKDAPVRDGLFTLSAPFEGTPRKIAELSLRFRSVEWANDRVAIVEERRWKDRKVIMLAVSPSAAASPAQLFEGSFEDHYHDPGLPFEVMNDAGKSIVQTTPDGNGMYLHGLGASAEGDRPFVSVMNLNIGEMKRMWQSEAPFFEMSSAVVDGNAPLILVERESRERSPNYFLKNVAMNSFLQVTNFPNPYGDAELPKKQVLKYKRDDGVELSANLYLPPGYKSGDGPLPTLMEAYPTEYKTKQSAGQISGSPYEFPFLYWGSPVPFATQGYAVLENATIPIVGEGQAEPNDTYVEQLVASAKAAIDEGVRLGVVDRSRVAVMGHSYGAFMTANLLAHSELFKAGIARSGAYNRTLTPFGFQNEDRTYWQAPEVYYKMSPFSYADKIKTPILLIHGEADNNTGTFPIQSDRLFSAIKGQGGTVRFVLLPLESHGYAGRESVLHMFWEMNNWLNTYVKNPQASPAATQP